MRLKKSELLTVSCGREKFKQGFQLSKSIAVSGMKSRRLYLQGEGATSQPHESWLEGPATSGCEIAISDLWSKMGSLEISPGPRAANTPRIVSKEVVLMTSGLGRARRRCAVTTEAATIGGPWFRRIFVGL